MKKFLAMGIMTVVLVAAVALLNGNQPASAGGSPKGAMYVGTGTCRACHMTEFGTWKKMKHATVFSALQGDEKKNPDCLKCHTTGYGEPGGFVSEATTEKMENVGCEACHGPGSEHVKAAKESPSGDWDKKIDKVPQNACIKCHNPHINQKERAEAMRKK